MKVFYLCDGEKENCKKNTCYKNGRGCKYTSDVKHALNFKKAGESENSSFYEKEDVAKNETPSKN